jgi:hypothetical protein
MQRSILIVLIAIAAISCKQNVKTESDSQEAVNTENILAASVLELLETPAEYQDKEVAISGMVTHVCRHGGQKCFIVADDGETQIRIVPGGDIDEFKVDMEGSTVAFKGIFRILNAEQAVEHVEDHEAQAHHEVEQSHSSAEKAEYFVEALEFKEVTP